MTTRHTYKSARGSRGALTLSAKDRILISVRLKKLLQFVIQSSSVVFTKINSKKNKLGNIQVCFSCISLTKERQISKEGGVGIHIFPLLHTGRCCNKVPIFEANLIDLWQKFANDFDLAATFFLLQYYVGKFGRLVEFFLTQVRQQKRNDQTSGFTSHSFSDLYESSCQKFLVPVPQLNVIKLEPSGEG